MQRSRTYRRFQRRRAISRKKRLSRKIHSSEWFFGIGGKYDKGHIGCGCGLCKPTKRFGYPSWEDQRKSIRFLQDIRNEKRGLL